MFYYKREKQTINLMQIMYSPPCGNIAQLNTTAVGIVVPGTERYWRSIRARNVLLIESNTGEICFL